SFPICPLACMALRDERLYHLQPARSIERIERSRVALFVTLQDPDGRFRVSALRGSLLLLPVNRERIDPLLHQRTRKYPGFGVSHGVGGGLSMRSGRPGEPSYRFLMISRSAKSFPCRPGAPAV